MKMRIERAEPKPLEHRELSELVWYVIVDGPLLKGLLVKKNCNRELIIGGWVRYCNETEIRNNHYAEADLTTIREKDGHLLADPLKPTLGTINGKDTVPWGWYEVVEAPGHLPCYAMAVCIGDGLMLMAWDKTLYTHDLASCTLRPINPGDKIVFEEE